MPTPGRSVWAALQLLDRQIVDRNDMPAAKVDDLEFALPDDSESESESESDAGDLPVLTDILCGPAALAGRFNRRLGHAIELLRRVIQPTAEPGPARVAWSLVREFDTKVTLNVTADEAGLTHVDRWLTREVLAHSPGSGITGRAGDDETD